MARIVVAWELGGNYGHISVLLPLALRLKKRGHEILFAVRDIKSVSQILANNDFILIQAPFVPVFKSQYREPLSFADILAGAGFGDINVLSVLATGWHNVFKLFHADILIGEYAPIANFAARLIELPCLHLNTGFGMPPAIEFYPCFRPWMKPSKEQLLKKEKLILNNINAIRLHERLPEFTNLKTALTSDVNLLVTLPELDHYQRRDLNRFIGPIIMSGSGIDIRWPERQMQRIFVYLRKSPQINIILEALKNSNAAVIAVIPDLDGRLIKHYQDDTFRIFTSLINLSVILGKMDLAITHSGHGTAALMLLSGVPMLLIPTTIEQWMLSRVLTKQGLAITVTINEQATRFSKALKQICMDSSIRDNSKQVARKYASFQSEHVLDRLTATIERMPEWKRMRSGDKLESLEEQ